MARDGSGSAGLLGTARDGTGRGALGHTHTPKPNLTRTGGYARRDRAHTHREQPNDRADGARWRGSSAEAPPDHDPSNELPYLATRLSMGLDSHPPHEEQSPTAPNHVMLEIRQVRFRFSGFADLMEVPGFG